MRELARSTGVSLAGLYHYFPDKQELLYQLEKHTFEALLNLGRAVPADADPRQRLRRFIRGHVEYFLAHRAAAEVLAHEDASLSGERARTVAALKRAYYDLAYDLVAAVLPPATEKSRLRALVLSLFGMLNWIPTWHRAGRDLESSDLAALIGDLFEKGACPQAEAARAIGAVIGI